MLSENIVACLLPGTSFGGCLVSRSRFSAEILPGFFAKCRKLFVLAGFSSVFVSNGASWKIMLLFIGINSAITSCFSDLTEHGVSPSTSVCSEFVHYLYYLLPEC